MANLFELKKQREFALNKADVLLKASENGHRQLTEDESAEVTTCMAAVSTLDTRIGEIQRKNTITRMMTGGRLIVDGAAGQPNALDAHQPVVLTSEYMDDFFAYIGTAGKKIGAALYEGSSPAGGFAVPSMVDGQIVALAPSEMGVRKLATIIPTAMDIKIPRQTAYGTATAKAESGGSSNSFGESDPTIDQFTLSAFMAGITHTISWELAQDVPSFQQFAIADMILAQQMYEENLFVNGTGTGQAQGLIGNTGVGTGVLIEPDNKGNFVTVDSTFDVLGTLNEMYHPGASWLMTRATGVVIRKAQAQSNLFTPVWNRIGDKDYLHGYPVEFSSSMPAAARGNTPVLFGDFKFGYVIGDRGGSGLNVKILDQIQALQGQIVLLCYRRLDGRVRRSEAIQQIKVAAS